MNNELTPIDEQVLDAMLVETLGNVGPPNLSGEILERLQQTSADVRPVVHSVNRVGAARRSVTKTKVTAMIAALAALAATFLLAIWLGSDHGPQNSSPTLADNDSSSSEMPGPELDWSTPQVDLPLRELPGAAPPNKSRRGIPLDLASKVGDDQPNKTQTDQDSMSPRSQESLEAVVLVSKQVDSELRGYWDAIGIEPSSDASGKEIVARLSILLGTKLSADSIDDPEKLQSDISQRKTSRVIANRWLQQITEGGLSRVDQKATSKLIGELAACFRTERAFDRTIARWIGGQSANAAAFYAAVSSGPKHARDSIAMDRRLAALTMNVDLRCTRCHDSYIEGNGRQKDYWAFAGFLRRGVMRSPDGQVTIDGSKEIGKPFFYGLADGRQGIVEPGVTTAWMKSQSDQPIMSVREWSQQLVGSPELARGVVNSLWQLVHGQPLHGRVVDPISAPHNDSLDRLEDKLVEDLMSSQFNVARTLALIIASPATRRSVPVSLLPENALVASESETTAAKNAVDAFAAALPPRNQLAMNDRMDQVMRVAGMKLNSDGSPIVAQIGAGSDNARSRNPGSSALSVDFPGPAKSHPVQWLSLIEDKNSQVEHLGYLAGMSQVPDNVLQVAEKMRDAGDTSTALHRVWWMVRP